MERKDAKKELEKMIEKTNGELYLGMAHHFYGLLKGTVFRLKTDNLDSILDFVENTMGIKEISKDTMDSDQIFLLNIYERIMMVTSCQIIPESLIADKEKYQIVSNLDEYKKEVLEEIDAHKSEPYYHRLGEY